MADIQVKEKYNKTWQEVAENFDKGENVYTAELGGISPGYELAIQLLLFNILLAWPKDKEMPPPVGNEYPEEYEVLVDKIATKLDKKIGFSGAQVGAAKGTAYQFIKFGYSEMMNKLPCERELMLSKADFGVNWEQ